MEDDFEIFMDIIEEFLRLNFCNYKYLLIGVIVLMVSVGKGWVEDVKLLLFFGVDIFVVVNNGYIVFDWVKNNG